MPKFKECPYCGEEILAKAIKCKHCHSMLGELKLGYAAEKKVTSPPPPPPMAQSERKLRQRTAPPPPPGSIQSATVPSPVPANTVATPTKKRGKGGCIILIFILLMILLGGGFLAYKFILSNGINGITLTKPDTDTLIGSWSSVGDYDEAIYLKFNTDGTLHIASPGEGYWTTLNYRLEKENDTYYLDINNDYDTEEWERVNEIEFAGKDKLLVTDLYSNETTEATRISDQQLQDVTNQLEYLE